MRRTALPTVLLVLLLSSSAVPMATAQDSNDTGGIVFGKELQGQEPDYWEGEEVEINLVGTFPRPPNEVVVDCLDCPEGPYSVDIEPTTRMVLFPDSFPRASPENQPRWNGTWRVRVNHESGSDAVGDITMASRTFDVFLTDQFQRNTTTYHPGNRMDIRASGYPRGSDVTARVYYLPTDGSGRELVWQRSKQQTDINGIMEFTWDIPLSEAERVNCASGCNDYELEVQGAPTDKATETVPLRIEQATMTPVTLAYPQAPNRTETLELLFMLRYNTTDRLVHPADLTTSGNRDDAALTVYLERITPAGEVERVDTLEASFELLQGGFYATWHVPRDLKLDAQTESFDYRFTLAPTEDRWGNDLPRTPMERFQIHPYYLKPTVEHQPHMLERQEEARFVFNFTYADGTYLRPGDNDTQLEAELQRVRDDNGELVRSPSYDLIATYDEDGRWVWTHKFPYDYTKTGTWNFTFTGTPEGTQAQDEHGNRLVKNSTRQFSLGPASPRIELRTTVDGETRGPREGFHRGDTVQLHVTTTYPDGTPISQDDLAFPEHRNGLPVKIHRVNQDGVETNVTRLRLELASAYQGLWRGSFDIPKVRAGAPVGTWGIEVEVEDNVTTPAPNRNVSTFERDVHPDVLDVSTYMPPRSTIVAGRDLDWAFRIRDSDRQQLTDEDIGTGVTVDVVRWTNGAPGATVVDGIQPYYEPDRGRGAWSVTWSIPRSIDAGTYAFVVSGTDLHGNELERTAHSSPFNVRLPHSERGALIQPPLTVKRGEQVVVAFHGRVGDYGLEGGDHPRILLERSLGFDRWDVMNEDLWKPREGPGTQHHAVWNTTTSSPEGTYRFRLEGRGPDHAVLSGTTHTFNVTPRNLTRTVTMEPVPFVEKGSTVVAKVERQLGDRLQRNPLVVRSTDGDVLPDPSVSVRDTGENWTLHWRVPYDVQDLGYILQLQAQDRYGNPIEARAGPVAVGNVNLTTETLTEPAGVVARGDTADLVFRVLYPDRSLMTPDHGHPTVLVLRGSEEVTRLNATFDGVNWHARWTPPAPAEITQYRFRVLGHDKAGNLIPALESASFTLKTGTLTRDMLNTPPGSVKRFDAVSAAMEARPGDEYVSFTLYHHGAFAPGARGSSSQEPRQLGTLPHEWNPTQARYDVTWTPAQDAPLGWYEIRVEGEDGHGNIITSTTGPFQLQPDIVRTRYVEGLDAVEPGRTVVVKAKLTYPNGEEMTPQDGEPAFVMRLNSRAIQPGPVVTYESDTQTWVATWEAPSQIPSGVYDIELRGRDDHGNSVSTRQTDRVSYEPGAVQQITGASVPGPGAPLALAAIAAALLLQQRRRP